MGLFGNPLSSLLGSSLLETIVSNQCWGLEEAATNLPVICQYMGVERRGSKRPIFVVESVQNLGR